MNNTGYLLTYRYTNASVEAVVMKGDNEAYKIDLCRMVTMSVGKPWRLNNICFDMINVANENKNLTVLMESETFMVIVTATLSNEGILSFEVEWKNTSEETLENVMLGINISVDSEDIDNVIIPSYCYNCVINENGEFDSDIIQGDGFIAEEHRLPIPAVFIEKNKKASGNILALYSEPSECSLNDNFDNEWSIGIVKDGGNVSMVLLSSGTMLGGQKDYILCSDDVTCKYERGYFDMPADAEIVKCFYICDLDFQKSELEFDRVVATAYELYRPQNRLKNSQVDFCKYKSIALRNRFIDSDGYVGYGKLLLSKKNEDKTAEMAEDDDCAMHYTDISNLWTIENLSAAWCDVCNSLKNSKRDGITRSRRCVDFYLEASKTKKKGLRYLCYDYTDMKWKFALEEDVIPSCEMGLMAYYLAEIIQYYKEHSLNVSTEWIDALRETCDFISSKRRFTKDGMYPKYWTDDGSVYYTDVSALGITCVCALIKAYEVTNQKYYIVTAIKLLPKYYEAIVIHHKTIINKAACFPSILDNDKLALTYFIIAAESCYEVTNDEKYLKMALTASEKILTYVNVINYELKKDSKLTKMGIDTRGLSYASKKIRGMNTILPIYEIKAVSDASNNSVIKKYVDIIINAMTQLASTGEGEYGFMAAGEQPEFLYTTNWTNGKDVDMSEWRGGYADFNDLRELIWAFKQILKLSGTNINK